MDTALPADLPAEAKPLLDGIPAALFWVDTDGTVLFATRAGLALLGQVPEGLVGRGLDRLFAVGAEAAEPLRRLAAGEPLRDHEARLRHRDGSIRHVLLSLEARPAGGAPAPACLHAVDITDRKEAEEALRRSGEQLHRSQKMEALGRLAAGVAHDFNNLLTAVSGYSELLLRAMPQDASLRSHVEEIRKAGERATGLTRRLLAFGRKRPSASRPFDAAQALADMRRMLGRVIGEDIELVAVAEPGLLRACADPGQVEQMILNLAVNARDAMPRGGTLRVEVANARLDATPPGAWFRTVPGNYVRLSIADTGVGMEPDVMAHLCEPFFTTKPPGRGTGLGLSMVYGMVQQSGGNLVVRSEPGRGTEVAVYLPAFAAAETAAPPGAMAEASAAPPRQAGATVLLAEDEDPVRHLVSQVLKAHGYHVLEAASGADALSLASRHGGAIDILLTDVVMGAMGGRELAERLAAVRPGTRVLYMSGYTEDAVLRHGVHQNSVAFIGKPFSPSALVQKLRELMSPLPGAVPAPAAAGSGTSPRIEGRIVSGAT